MYSNWLLMLGLPLVLIAVAIGGCSDDDADLPRDAGAGSGSRADSGGSGSGGDGCGGCTRDKYDCSGYPLEAFPWPEGVADGMARRASLSLLCFGECNPRETLADFEARLRCGDTGEGGMDDGGVDLAPDDRDGGLPLGGWRRSEGCGSVQFSTRSPAEPRFFNFDRETGELIGFAGLERFSIIGRGGGFGCAAPAWVAGEVRADCRGETVSICEVR